MTDFFRHRDNLTSRIEDAFHLYLIFDDWNDRPQCTGFFCHSDSIWVRFLARSQIAGILLENVVCIDSVFTTFLAAHKRLGDFDTSGSWIGGSVLYAGSLFFEVVEGAFGGAPTLRVEGGAYVASLACLYG